ncbi:unnamed protein product [Linum trigynum]|uniref:RNase H type-1 domain-containing protein n=1 Tax=Linum trigynum TaxID=586398 RepID=A0AAV2FMW2_9ROSI
MEIPACFATRSLRPQNTSSATAHLLPRVWLKLGFRDNSLTVGLNFAEWMAKQLRNPDTGLLFGVAAWYLWKRRNEKIFQHKWQEASTLAERISCWTQTISAALESNGKALDNHTNKSAVDLAWQPPPPGWVAVNTDGSVKQPNSQAAAGGIIRDHLGRCLGAFSSNLGSCTITRAELMGAAQGLKLAWDQGHRRVQLRLDSRTALNIINSTDSATHRYHILAREIQKLLQQNWEVVTSHTFRECNKSADFLANKGQTVSIGFHLVDSLDPGLRFWTLYDSLGIAQSRLI